MTNLPVPNLFGTARDKAELFRERYSILQQVRNGFVLFNKIREQNAFSFLLLNTGIVFSTDSIQRDGCMCLCILASCHKSRLSISVCVFLLSLLCLTSLSLYVVLVEIIQT